MQEEQRTARIQQLIAELKQPIYLSSKAKRAEMRKELASLLQPLFAGVVDRAINIKFN